MESWRRSGIRANQVWKYSPCVTTDNGAAEIFQGCPEWNIGGSPVRFSAEFRYRELSGADASLNWGGGRRFGTHRVLLRHGSNKGSTPRGARMCRRFPGSELAPRCSFNGVKGARTQVPRRHMCCTEGCGDRFSEVRSSRSIGLPRPPRAKDMATTGILTGITQTRRKISRVLGDRVGCPCCQHDPEPSKCYAHSALADMLQRIPCLPMTSPRKFLFSEENRTTRTISPQRVLSLAS